MRDIEWSLEHKNISTTALQMVTEAMKLKTLASWKKSYDQPRQHIKKQRHYFANKGPSSKSYGFSSSHVWMWELDHKEGWTLKNWCFWTVVLIKTLMSPLDWKEIKPVNPKGNQSWISLRRTDAEKKLLYFGHLMRRANSLEKALMLGKIKGRNKKGTTEDKMVGWHHWLNGHGFEQAAAGGQGSLACWSPWSRKDWDTTEQLNYNSKKSVMM